MHMYLYVCVDTQICVDIIDRTYIYIYTYAYNSYSAFIYSSTHVQARSFSALGSLRPDEEYFAQPSWSSGGLVRVTPPAEPKDLLVMIYILPDLRYLNL